MTVVLAAAENVGGANALVPVVKKLSSDHARTPVLARGEAAKVFSAAEIEHRTLEEPAGYGPDLQEIACQNLADVAPDVLLLGTAWGPSLDKALLSAAQSAGVPSLAVLDMWSNYRERFVDPVSGELVLPTKVAVMDQVAFDEAMDAGLPEACLVITGQPYLEVVARELKGSDVALRAASIRQAWLSEIGDSEETRVVLFASESFSRDFGPETPYYRGYTETDALDGLAEAVELAGPRGLPAVRVVAKLHPEERIDSFRLGPAAAANGVLVVADPPAWPCILAADTVVGMTSMLLLESAVAGRPTISYQPGVKHPESFVGTRVGMVPSASSVGELAALLVASLQGESDAVDVRQFAFQGAADRVADVVLQLAAYGGVDPGTSVS